MSNFFFKNIPITNIINIAEDATTTTNYGFKFNKTNYANTKPLGSIGYMVDGVDIANTASALISSYPDSMSFTPPVGAKSLRFLGVGGGGGGGGGGGSAVSDYAGRAYADGGPGSSGQHGRYVYYNSPTISSSTPITITIGNAGNQGTGGAGKWSPNNDATGDQGVAGGAGNATILYINTTAVATANGGGYGNGGNGGFADDYSAGHAKAGNPAEDSYAGSAGTLAPSTTDGSVVDLSEAWDNNGLTPYGTAGVGGGGGGAVSANPPPSGGTGVPAPAKGFAQIIWLYG